MSVDYKCVKCGEITTSEDLENLYIGRVKCKNCGYRVLMKVRPPRVKIVKAR